MSTEPGEGSPAEPGDVVQVAASTDVGTLREQNEDACGVHREGPACALVVVADGVSSCEAGEVASQMAVEVVLRAYREYPATLTAGQRLYRAVQQANIEIYDRSIAVPELRGMTTTLTAAVVDRGRLTVVHVGDSRAYLLRDGALTQVTKDHTVAARRTRYGLLGRERARTHADRSVLTRSVGKELIVSRDQSTQELVHGDRVVLCSDGLYNVLTDAEIAREVSSRGDLEAACRALIEAANRRGAPDNVSAAVMWIVGPTLAPPEDGLWMRLRRLAGRG